MSLVDLGKYAGAISILSALGGWALYGGPPHAAWNWSGDEQAEVESCCDDTPPPRQIASVRPSDETLISISLAHNEMFFPNLLSALEAEQLIDSSERVIGVYLAGQTRAYLLSSFIKDESGVVNDLLGNMPVTVAHDPATNITRVFGDEPDTRIVMRAMEQNGERHLWCRGRLHEMDDPQIPLLERRFVVTTWGEWHAKYPRSAVCIGVTDDRVEPRGAPLAGDPVSSELES